MNTHVIINIVLIAIIVITLLLLTGYNKLVRQYNEVKRQKSHIDIILNKRFDLIPNIVECVKGYSKHESSTFEDVVKARNTYMNMKGNKLKEAENVNNKLNSLLALVEDYPELKASTQYQGLQHQLSSIETELSTSRTLFNNSVSTYNTTVQSIPTNIVAAIFNFKQTELYKADDTKKEDIKIKM